MVNKECIHITTFLIPTGAAHGYISTKKKTSTIMYDLVVHRHVPTTFIPLTQPRMAKHDYPFEARLELKYKLYQKLCNMSAFFIPMQCHLQ